MLECKVFASANAEDIVLGDPRFFPALQEFT